DEAACRRSEDTNPRQNESGFAFRVQPAAYPALFPAARAAGAGPDAARQPLRQGTTALPEPDRGRAGAGGVGEGDDGAGGTGGRTGGVAGAGGWRRGRSLRGDQRVDGRLWDRTPPRELGLRFAARSLDFLMWVTAVKPTDPKNDWAPAPEELAVGDWLLLFFA